MIAEVGRLDGATAPREIDVAGRYVVPGFIDAHVHGDLMLLADPIHLPALRQGVTTYIIGQDGSSFAPASPATLDYMRRYTAGFNGNPAGLDYSWRSVDEYLARFNRTTAINVAYLIPNGNVRMEVMGLDPRPATRRRARCDEAARPRGDGRRGGRALDGTRLHPQPLCRRPRDRGALRGDRARQRRLRHAHARLWPEGSRGDERGLRDRQAVGRRRPHLALQRAGRRPAPLDRPGRRPRATT